MRHALRILIVEDEVLIAMGLEMELRHAGCVVCRQVVTGEDAIASVPQDVPDLILMDIRLAGDIDGIETARQIQACADIPIIFMTGYPDRDIETRANTLKPLGFFVKPIRIHDLKPLIESVEKKRE